MFKKIFKNKDAERHDEQPKNMPYLVKTEDLEKKVNSLLFIFLTNDCLLNFIDFHFLILLAFHLRREQRMGL